MNYDFSYLSDPFRTWYDEKSQKHGESFIHTENPITFLLSEHEALYAKLDMTQDDFEKAFLKPYYRLVDVGYFNFEVISEIITLISKVVGKALIIQNDIPEAPFSISTTRDQDRYAQALDWTCMQVRELRLNGLKMPYDDSGHEAVLQCRYCGKLNADDKGRQFNKKRKYCHDIDCKEKTSVNPEEHIKCCYGKWAKRKKLLVQALKRHYKGRKKGMSYFKDFCDDLYDNALTVHNPIRTADAVMFEFLKSIGVGVSDCKKIIHGIEGKDSYLLMKQLLSKGKQQ